MRERRIAGAELVERAAGGDRQRLAAGYRARLENGDIADAGVLEEARSTQPRGAGTDDRDLGVDDVLRQGGLPKVSLTGRGD